MDHIRFFGFETFLMHEPVPSLASPFLGDMVCRLTFLLSFVFVCSGGDGGIEFETHDIKLDNNN